MVSTKCGHCSQPLHLEIDSELGCRVREESANPLVFMPMVSFAKLTDPCITDAF